MTEQMDSLVKIAKKKHKDLIKLVGQDVQPQLNSYSSEKLQLYISYPEKYCTFNGKFWDIPQYSNGSTRHAQCLFLLGSMACGDAEYAYVGSWDEINENLKSGEREKILIEEYIDDNLVELIWSFDMCAPRREGQHWYSVDYFWFAARINGIVYEKHKDIKNLKIPPLKHTCRACGKEKSISKLKYVKAFGWNADYWICKEPKELYSKCAEY